MYAALAERCKLTLPACQRTKNTSFGMVLARVNTDFHNNYRFGQKLFKENVHDIVCIIIEI